MNELLCASRPRRLTILVLGALLIVLAAATISSAVALVQTERQVDYGESLVYGHASRLLVGENLYQPVDRPPYTQVAYMPLYYWAVAGLHLLVGPGFGPGRALSLLAGLITAGCVGFLTAQLTRSWMAGTFAALMLLALAFPGPYGPWLAVYRVDMLGIALSIGAITGLATGTSRSHLLLAGLLAGLALFTKQNLFAASVAGTIWLAGCNVRKAALFGIIVLATLLLPVVVLRWSSSGAFLGNAGVLATAASPMAKRTVISLLTEFVVTQGIPALLAIWCVVQTRAWSDRALRLIAVYWLASLVPIAGIVSIGAGRNYWIEFAAATAILATVAIWRCLRPNVRPAQTVTSMLPLCALAVGLGVLTPARFISIDRGGMIEWGLRWQDITAAVASDDGLAPATEQVRDEPRAVLAEPMDVLALADRPILLEPFLYSTLEQVGAWNSQPLVDQICAGEVGLLVLGYPISTDVYPSGTDVYPEWPRTVMAALRSSMAPAGVEGNRYLYRPRAAGDPAAEAACLQAAARLRP